MAINSRNKGATFERKIANLLSEKLGYKFNRTPQSGAFSTKVNDDRLAGDLYSPDVDFAYVIECKKYATFNVEELITGAKQSLTKWLTQLEKEKGKKKGLLIFQRDYGKIMAMIEEDLDIENSLKYKNYTIALFDDVIDYLKEKL